MLVFVVIASAAGIGGVALGWALRAMTSWCPQCGSGLWCSNCDLRPGFGAVLNGGIVGSLSDRWLP
jgi:hypothetical protein